MMTVELKIEALSAQAFAPFGEVIAVDSATTHYPINGGTTERYHDLAHLDAGPEGHLIVSIFRGQPRVFPVIISTMERHPYGTQAFMPLGGEPYLVVVAPADSLPEASSLRVFLARADQGVNYAKEVWHHSLMALNETSDFLVLDRSGPGKNCKEYTLNPPALINDCRIVD